MSFLFLFSLYAISSKINIGSKHTQNYITYQEENSRNGKSMKQRILETENEKQKKRGRKAPHI